MSQHPVTVDFGGQRVRVGTATQNADGSFTLTLGGALQIGPAEAPARAVGASLGGHEGICLPNYGRSKGAPVLGASLSDLNFYKRGCERSLNDPSKSRWHDKERQLLAAIEAEIARQGGGDDYTPPQGPGMGSDDDIPFNVPSGSQ